MFGASLDDKASESNPAGAAPDDQFSRGYCRARNHLNLELLQAATPGLKVTVIQGYGCTMDAGCSIYAVMRTYSMTWRASVGQA